MDFVISEAVKVLTEELRKQFPQFTYWPHFIDHDMNSNGISIMVKKGDKCVCQILLSEDGTIEFNMFKEIRSSPSIKVREMAVNCTAHTITESLCTELSNPRSIDLLFDKMRCIL